MIDRYFDRLESIIQANELYIKQDVERIYTSQTSAYFCSEVVFIDGSKLIVFEHVKIERNTVIRTDYRYHYMPFNNKLIFRYDNAPHHKNIKTFPHHKHIEEKVLETITPNLEIVLGEITKIIIFNYQERNQ